MPRALPTLAASAASAAVSSPPPSGAGIGPGPGPGPGGAGSGGTGGIGVSVLRRYQLLPVPLVKPPRWSWYSKAPAATRPDRLKAPDVVTAPLVAVTTRMPL